MNNYAVPRTCEICGEGYGFSSGADHTACAKIKQEMHKDDKRKPARQTVSTKNADSYARYCTRHDR